MPPERVDRREVVRSEAAFWDKWAEDNEHLLLRKVPTIGDLGDPFVRSSNERFVKGIGTFEGLRILDIGCGLGSLSLYAASKGADVVGIDLARGMARRCRRQSKALHLDGEFIVGDAENLPFEDGCFDRVIGERTVHHFPDLKRFFEEVQRVLAVGGKAAFIEPQKNNPIVEINRKLLRPEGRTFHEHPLVPDDIRVAQSCFRHTEVETFYLISPISFLFRYFIKNERLFESTFKSLQYAEKGMASWKPLWPYCWQILLLMTKESPSLSSLHR